MHWVLHKEGVCTLFLHTCNSLSPCLPQPRSWAVTFCRKPSLTPPLSPGCLGYPLVRTLEVPLSTPTSQSTSQLLCCPSVSPELPFYAKHCTGYQGFSVEPSRPRPHTCESTMPLPLPQPLLGSAAEHCGNRGRE